MYIYRLLPQWLKATIYLNPDGVAGLPIIRQVRKLSLSFRAGITYEDNDGNKHKGFMLSGNNHSDDLFMFVTLPIESKELNDHTTYYAQFLVEFASNVASEGCAGIGGAPNGVTVKTGLTAEEPVASGSYMRLNIDKGNQVQGGKDVVVLGDIGSDSIDTSLRYRYQKQ